MTTTESLRDRLYSLQSEGERYAETHNVPVTTHAQAVAEAPRPTLTRSVHTPKPNRFGGYCSECHEYVAEGAGLLGGKVNGRWTVVHSDCTQRPVEPRPPNAPDRPTQPYVPTASTTNLLRTADGKDPKIGIFTVENAFSHSTFRVYAQPEDSDFFPGATLLQLLTGSDNTGSYTTMGRIEGGHFIPFKKNRQIAGRPESQWFSDLRILFTDPDAVLDARNCLICNRILSSPESIALGIGPTCAAQ